MDVNKFSHTVDNQQDGMGVWDMGELALVKLSFKALRLSRLLPMESLFLSSNPQSPLSA